MKKLSKLTTIPQHITLEENLHPEATGDFTTLLNDFTLALRIISRDVRRAGLNDILGLTDETNVHGEIIQNLDIHAATIIKKIMSKRANVCAMVSEEDENVIYVDKNGKAGKYILLFDPLDGSSNIDVNATIGTIFSIYKRLDNSEEKCGEKDILQPGHKQVAAGYALYGSSTVMVYSTGHGVHMFTYDPTVGEFLLIRENVKIPPRGKYYSVNEGYYHKWDQETREYIDYLKTPTEDKPKTYSLRYIGSFVADFHRTLLSGGIFMYPRDSSKPEGKLRLFYEANPMAMLVEQAGGKAIDGKQRILEIQPTHIHQRTPLIIGGKDDVEEYEKFLRREHPYQKSKR